MTHTPGPWAAVEDRQLASDFGFNIQAGDAVIAVTRARHVSSYDQCRANSLLMAAAPKLFAACEAVVEAADEYDGIHCGICMAPLAECACVVVDCRAAIAAARGETP